MLDLQMYLRALQQELPVSEEPVVYATGAQRVPIEHEVRYDLESPYARERRARIYAEGSIKYDKPGEVENFRKGLPFHDIWNHMDRHLTLWKQGDRSEDHLAKASWALDILMEQESTHPELNDLFFKHRVSDHVHVVLGAGQASSTAFSVEFEDYSLKNVHYEYDEYMTSWQRLRTRLGNTWNDLKWSVIDAWDRLLGR